MNAVAITKHPAIGTLAAASGWGLSFCEASTPYLRTFSLMIGILCGLLALVNGCITLRSHFTRRRLEERAVEQHIEQFEDIDDIP